MPFQDLLKQPLPSQIGNDYYMTEAVSIKNAGEILKGIKTLKTTYKASMKEIKESIKSIKNQMSAKKFKGALNSIHICRKKVISDRNEITRQIKNLESKGLTKSFVKKLSTGIEIAGNVAITASAVHSMPKIQPYATGLFSDIMYKSDKAKSNSNNQTDNCANSYGFVNKDGTPISEEEAEKMWNAFVKRKEKEAKQQVKTESSSDIKKLAKAAAPVIAATAATTLTYNKVQSFITIQETYEKYYDGIQKTLDKLEDKCETQSQNIKECLVDFVNLTYNMEMLMESAESEDDFDESIEFESPYDDFEDDNIEEDIDISDMSDADLDELEDELADSDVEDEMNDDDEEVDLTPEEEQEADDFMSLAATTELVRDELSATERAEFYSDPVQAQIAVMEGFMLESDFQDGDMVTEKFYNKTRVQFSKEDRKRQLFAVALNASARAHNDPDYIKLQKVQQMRRVLKARIRKKYRSEAVRRVKVYMQRLKASKSGVLAKIGEKLHREEK